MRLLYASYCIIFGRYFDRVNISNVVCRYKWHPLPPIPYDQHVTGGHVVLGASSVVFNDELYVLGGAPYGRPALRYPLTYTLLTMSNRMNPTYAIRHGVLEP